MREIGQQTLLKYRHPRTGKPEEKFIEDVVKRLTRDEYGHNSKYRRKLVVMLHAPDTITIKPQGFRTEALTVTVEIGEIYKTLLARKHLVAALEKARIKKAKKAEARISRARRAKERRFSAKLRKENAARG